MPRNRASALRGRMGSIYRPTIGPEDWRSFLAKPDLHWKTGYSARSLAHCWESEDGLPVEVAAALRQSGLANTPQTLLAIPEFKVALPGGRTQSQNDIFALMRLDTSTATVMVEGKVNEPFGPTVEEWMANAGDGKRERLAFLVDQLGLGSDPSALRYQLLHRTVSALITAEAFKTDLAVMLVHSFSQEHVWFDDFSRFAEALGVPAQKDRILLAPGNHARPLYIGWVTGHPRWLEA